MIRESKAQGQCGRSAVMLLGLAVFALMPVCGASASMIQIVPSSSTLTAGQSETVSVVLTSTQSFLLQSTGLAISYDSSRFSVSDVQLGALSSSASGFAQVFGTPSSGTPGIGEVTIATYTGTLGNQISGSVTSPVVGTLETFTLTALANAPTGGGQIILQQSFENTVTAVYSADTSGNAIQLTPSPTNSYNPSIDSTVMVTGTVPEPSSLILLGLGGGLVTLTGMIRKKKVRQRLDA